MNNTFKAKKSLGQNFIHAPFAIDAMVFNTNIEKGDKVIEVGPGKGALTEKLLNTGAKVIAFEKDDRAVSYIREKFKKQISSGDLTLIHGDILDFNIENNDYLEKDEKYKVSANIPYYITGELIKKFLETERQPENMVLMLQKEVARRIVGEKSEEKESILSISVKVYGEPKYITTVNRKFFRPIPSVDSAILAINNINKDFFEGIDEKTFFEILKAGFLHKRKVLIKNLESKIDKNALKNIWEIKKWDIKIRAESLKKEDWKYITEFCSRFPQK